jgi:gamma-glutamyl hercynylcysteine S-oxide synthase
VPGLVASTALFTDWYTRNRARSQQLFDLLSDEAYYSRPIDLRHPIVFYEGHIPAFSFNTLVKKALGGDSIDPKLEALFARGIDPPESTFRLKAEATNQAAVAHEATVTNQAEAASPDGFRLQPEGWPSRREVKQFAAEADRRVRNALGSCDLDLPGDPLLNRAEAVYTILEHEAMHHETLLYMWHRLPFEHKHRPDGYRPKASGIVPIQEWIRIPAGRATLGADESELPFSWDNERPHYEEDVEAFSIERHNVTNAEYMEFVNAGGPVPLFWESGDGGFQQRGTEVSGKEGRRFWYWRGMFELIPLPMSWPVYVTHEQAAAYAQWRGWRLPTEAEFQRAAYGVPSAFAQVTTDKALERRYPWGKDAPQPKHGVFDFTSWDPEPACTHPAGRSAWGVDDLVGNGWEWTSSVFAPFPGFQSMPSYPEYSADFFDGEHFVLKGASPATSRELIRPTFRNWFRPRYPYVYATFRCVK